jgi:small-conductance mechanosensitive channel
MVEVPTEVEATPAEYAQTLEPLVWGVVAFVVVLVAGNLLVRPAIVRVIRRRNQRNPTLVEAVGRYTRLGVLLVAVVFGLAASGYGNFLSRSALVVAAATLALGVAGQAVIGNLVSGLFLVVDPDFNVGDWIEWEGNAGVVETIRFRVTRVRTGDFGVVTVPNTTLATSAVTRPYSRNRLRIAVGVRVPVDVDVDDAAAILREEATAMPEVRAVPRPAVTVGDVADGTVGLRVRFWLDGPTPRREDDVRSTYVRRLTSRLPDLGSDGDYPDVAVEIDGG